MIVGGRATADIVRDVTAEEIAELQRLVALEQVYEASADRPSATAQGDYSESCLRMQQLFNAPHYCDCKEGSTAFAFPLDATVTDTAWYSATIDDLRQGITAYWFADGSVTLEAFVRCVSKEPTIRLTIGGDQMREIDAAEIQAKLDKYGAWTGLADPHLRVVPNGSVSGRVYCTPYDQGPHSTCDDPLPVRTTMVYVSSHEDDVYEWEADRLPADGKAFVQWKQRQNSPCTVRVTRGSCDGEVVAEAALADSTRLFFPDPALLRSACQQGQSLYFHFLHDASQTGRIRFCTVPIFEEHEVDTTFCQGLGLQLPDTVLTETTYYRNDSVWYKGDTVYINAYDLHVTPPETVRDTLRLNAQDLPRIYRNQYFIPADGWGDHDVLIHWDGQCDEHYLLHVRHRVDTLYQTIDTTLCEGRIYTYDDLQYTADTTFVDSVWVDDDTFVIRDVNLLFSEPEPEYDTVYVAENDLLYGYFYEPANQLVYDYGDYIYTVRARNRCTRIILLSVQQTVETGLTETDAHGKAYLRRDEHGLIYIVRDGRAYNLLGQQLQ